MSLHRASRRSGAHSRHMTIVAVILVVLLISSLVGIWQASAGITPLGTVSVSVSPATKTVMVGDTFTVQVLINAGGNEVQSADLFLTYDPTYVQMTGNPTAGDLPLVLAASHDNGAGTAVFGAFKTGDPVTGSIVLCNLTFQAMAETAGTAIGSSGLLVAGPVGVEHTSSWSDGTIVIDVQATATPTATATATSTSAPPTATNTARPPTATHTAQVPTPTDTAQSPTATNTPENPPTATPTDTPVVGSLCITVFYDLNGDGVRQPGEMMLTGAQVRVFDSGGSLVAEFTSDAINQPRCVPLASGRVYSIEVTPLPGFTETEPHTSTAIVRGGRAVSLDFGETSPLGVPTVDADRLLLPLILTSHTAENPFPQTTLDRIGVAVYRSDEPGEAHLAEYPLDRVKFGWYVDWWFQVDYTKPTNLTYVRIVPVDALYPTDPGSEIWQHIRDQVALDPGAIWLIGNEPECVHQGNRSPAEYAAIYKAYYDFLKGVDPNCTVGIGGIVQPTPLRLEWLDQCLASYLAQFGEPMPIEVWNIHNMILNEERDGVGADIPVGLPDDEGTMPGWWNSDDFSRFTQQIIDFRTWMADNGFQNLPLFVSEFGVLYPESWFDGLGGLGGEQRIKNYMTNTFDWMLNATDPTIGCPADGNRLVQRWAYLSLNSPTYEEDPVNHFSGHLCYKADQTMTKYGLYWEELVNGYLGSGS